MNTLDGKGLIINKFDAGLAVGLLDKLELMDDEFTLKNVQEYFGLTPTKAKTICDALYKFVLTRKTEDGWAIMTRVESQFEYGKLTEVNPSITALQLAVLEVVDEQVEVCRKDIKELIKINDVKFKNSTASLRKAGLIEMLEPDLHGRINYRLTELARAAKRENIKFSARRKIYDTCGTGSAGL